MAKEFEVYFVGGTNGFISLNELREMIAKEIRRGFEPTMEFKPNGDFVFNFYEVTKITDA